jgi:hypothetical protein
VDEGDGGLSFLILVYMIFNGIVLYNGLIGIFGQVFTTSDERVDQTFDKIERMEARLENIIAMTKKLMTKRRMSTAVNAEMKAGDF